MEKGNFTEQDNKLKPKCVETEHLKIKNIFQHWQLYNGCNVTNVIGSSKCSGKKRCQITILEFRKYCHLPMHCFTSIL